MDRVQTFKKTNIVQIGIFKCSYFKFYVGVMCYLGKKIK